MCVRAGNNSASDQSCFYFHRKNFLAYCLGYASRRPQHTNCAARPHSNYTEYEMFFYSNYITIDLIIAACLFCIRLYRLSFVWERILHSLDCNQCLKRHYDLGTKRWHCLGDEMEQMIRCSFFCSSVIPTCNCLRRIRTIYMQRSFKTQMSCFFFF